MFKSVLLLLTMFLTGSAVQAATEEHSPTLATGPVLQVSIEGPIGPATSDYVARGLDRAAERSARLIILQMDTPGGLDLAMRDIIKRIIASPVPVAAYVAPSGARAASAGTYILYASHIAVMAPGTNLGAATPVPVATPTIGEDRGPPEDKKRAERPGREAMEHKLINDAVAYLQGLARLRGRNQSWAEKAVREAASLPAEEALKLKVIDLIAFDTADVLKKLEGRLVNVLGQDVVLRLAGSSVETLRPDWRSELLAVITNPNVAYVLMLLGIYGLILEFSHPGALVPGTVGAISLLLALYAFQVLPVNYAGLGLVLLGIALMVAEAFVPSFGALGLGGVVAFVIGSVILLDTDVPGLALNPGIIAAFAAASVVFFVFVLGLILKARRQPVTSGREALIGGVGVVLEDFEHQGPVRIHREIWTARTPRPLRRGDAVSVRGLDGLTLIVVPAQPQTRE